MTANRLSPGPLFVMVILAISLLACTRQPAVHSCNDLEPQDFSKDGILLVGDSISEGYTPRVKSLLKAFSVVHSLCNGESSSVGRKTIEQWLMSRPRWKVVTFNHGYWDMQKNGPQQRSVEEYSRNLREEAGKIKLKAEHVIFFTTPAVPPNVADFSNAVVDKYNAAAVAVMNELHIKVYDINKAGAALMDLHKSPSDIHFTESGYSVLGDFVAQSVLREIGQ